jgi:beta-glucanase (GH16 family)
LKLRSLLAAALAAFVLTGTAGAAEQPPAATVDAVTETAITLGSLECGTTYRLGIAEQQPNGSYSQTQRLYVPTSDCTEPPPGSGGGGGEVPVPPAIAGQNYRLAFSDDFDILDRAIWDDHIWYDESPHASWTGFQEVENGVLHLRTSRNFFWGGGANDNYPTNTVTTQTSGQTFTFGYFEARMRWTGGNGAWPAFWLMSYRHANNQPPAGWPEPNLYCVLNGLPQALCYAAELDVFEGQGAQPETFYGTVHLNSCNCYGVTNEQNDNNWHNTGIDLTAGFHTYAMLWTATAITWYLDDVALMSAPVYDSTNQPMFLLLQTWTGGWTGGTDGTTPDLLDTQVDWVRVWQQIPLTRGAG